MNNTGWSENLALSKIVRTSIYDCARAGSLNMNFSDIPDYDNASCALSNVKSGVSCCNSTISLKFKIFCFESYCLEKNLQPTDVAQIFVYYGIGRYLETVYPILNGSDSRSVSEDIDIFIKAHDEAHQNEL